MNRQQRAGDDLEAELRNAMKRVDPPSGFADRVVARVRENEAIPIPGLWARVMQSFHAPVFRAAAAAALCVAVVAGSLEYRRHEREQGEAAKRQLMVAMRITGAKLSYAQQKVNEVGSHQRGKSRTEE